MSSEPNTKIAEKVAQSIIEKLMPEIEETLFNIVVAGIADYCKEVADKTTTRPPKLKQAKTK